MGLGDGRRVPSHKKKLEIGNRLRMLCRSPKRALSAQKEQRSALLNLTFDHPSITKS